MLRPKAIEQGQGECVMPMIKPNMLPNSNSKFNQICLLLMPLHFFFLGGNISLFSRGLSFRYGFELGSVRIWE